MNRDDVYAPDRVSNAAESETIPFVEEEVLVDKREVSTGRVRIRTLVETVEENLRADLKGEKVEVSRVPVERVVTEAPAIRTEGDVTIIPVLEEVLFVEKRLLLKEELHVRRLATTETVEVPVSLRKERASIERVRSGSNTIEEIET